MSARVDFFEGVKNLHPPNQARKRFDRNYSGTGSSDNDNIPGMMNVGRNTNDNIPIQRIPSWINRGSTPSWINRGNSFPKDQPPPPPEHTTTTSTQQPPFAYNEIHPRTSAHLHSCPSCDYPVMVQVTADLYYHHVTFIPAAMARTNQTHDLNNFLNQSQLPSQGRRARTPQGYSPVQEPEDEEEVSTLSNEPEEEEQPEIIMVTAPNKKSQQGFRTYASITAGKTIIDTKEDDKNPSEETEETEDNAHQEVIVDEKAKENTTASQVVDNGGEGDDDSSNDGFTTVVSWKSKIKAKAAAKAKEAAAHRYIYGRWRNRVGKHGRGSPREEHIKYSREPTDEQAMYAKVGPNDGGPRGEHDKRARGGLIRDGHDKHGRRWPKDEHGTGDLRENGHDKHGRKDEHGTGDPREGHGIHGRGSRERGQQRK